MKYVLCVLMLGLANVHDVCTAAVAETGDSLRLRRQLVGHTGLVRAALVLQGNRLATGSDDTTVRLWDVQEQACLGVLKGHTQAVTGLANLVKGKAIVSGSDDGTVRVWELPVGHCVRIIKHGGGPARSLAIARNGYVVLEKSKSKHIEYHPFKGTVFREGKHMDGGGILYQGAPDPHATALRKAGKHQEADAWSSRMNFLQVNNDLPVEDVATYSFVLNSACLLAGDRPRDPVAVLKQLNAIKQMIPDYAVRELTLLSDGNVAVRKADRFGVIQIMSCESKQLVQKIRSSRYVGGAMAGLPAGGLAIGALDFTVDIYLYNHPKKDIQLYQEGLEEEKAAQERSAARRRGGCVII